MSLFNYTDVQHLVSLRESPLSRHKDNTVFVTVPITSILVSSASVFDFLQVCVWGGINAPNPTLYNTSVYDVTGILSWLHLKCRLGLYGACFESYLLVILMSSSLESLQLNASVEFTKGRSLEPHYLWSFQLVGEKKSLKEVSANPHGLNFFFLLFGGSLIGQLKSWVYLNPGVLSNIM